MLLSKPHVSDGSFLIRHVLVSLALTGFDWILVALDGWVISLGIVHPPPVYIRAAVVLGAFFCANSLPGLPAALGTFEFAVVFILGLLGVAKETAVTIGLLVHFVLFFPPMFFAMLARWMQDAKSAHPSEADERQREGPRK